MKSALQIHANYQLSLFSKIHKTLIFLIITPILSFGQYEINKSGFISLEMTGFNIGITEVQIDEYDNSYVLSSELSNNQIDVVLRKYNDLGIQQWAVNMNHHNLNDYGLGLSLDSIGNPIVLATIEDSLESNNIYVEKYNSSGVSQWSYTYDGDDSGPEYATRIKVSSTGDIILTGSTWSNTEKGQVVIIKVDKAGTEQWVQTNGSPATNDIGVNITITQDNEIDVVGVDYTSATHDDFYIYRYKSDGTYDQTTTKNLGIAMDTISYVSSYMNRGLLCAGELSGDILTVCIDSLFDTLWAHVYDYQGYDDLPLSITYDNVGNVYVSGHGRNGQGSEALLFSLNSSGIERWNRSYIGDPDTLNWFQNLFFDDGLVHVSGAIYNGGYRSGVFTFDEGGDMKWKSLFDDIGSTPKTLFPKDESDFFLVCDKDTVVGFYELEIHQRAFEDKDTLDFTFRENELVITIDTSKISKSQVDLLDKNFFELGAILDSSIIDSMLLEFGESADFGEPIVCRVFKDFPTTRTQAIARDGSTISIRPFWNSFVFSWETDIDEYDFIERLSEVEEIESISLNQVGWPMSVPNDSHYANDQEGLHPISGSDIDGVDMPGAWDVNKGDPQIVVGVFDSGIDFNHEDLGDGDFGQDPNAIVIEGYDFIINDDIINAAQLDGHSGHHGTKMAGVIGAARNNSDGIAGAAGGDWGANEKGVSLAAFKIYDDNNILTESEVANAITKAVDDYNVNILNFSYGSVTTADYPYNPMDYDKTLTGQKHRFIYDAFNYASQMGVTTIAARGQGKLSERDLVTWPSGFPNHITIGVGACANDSEPTESVTKGATTTYFYRGKGIDLMAPGADADQLYSTTESVDNYASSDGTSSAAALISGISSLIISEANNSTPMSEYGFPIYPEDVLNILTMSCTDKDVTGFDDLSGNGLINAKTALDYVDFPKYRIHHYSGTSSTYTLNLIEDSVLLSYFPGGGNAYGNVYDIVYEFPNNTRTGDQIISAWGRPSRTDGFWFKDPTSSHFELSLQKNGCEVDSYNSNTFYVKTRVYRALYYKAGANFFPVHSSREWHPNNDLTTNVISWSALVHDPNATLADFRVGNEETLNQRGIFWSLFPNPSQGNLTIRIVSDQGGEGSVIIRNSLGQQIYSENILSLEDVSKSIDISGMPSGVYFVTLNSYGMSSSEVVVLSK